MTNSDWCWNQINSFLNAASPWRAKAEKLKSLYQNPSASPNEALVAFIKYLRLLVDNGTRLLTFCVNERGYVIIGGKDKTYRVISQSEENILLDHEGSVFVLNTSTQKLSRRGFHASPLSSHSEPIKAHPGAPTEAKNGPSGGPDQSNNTTMASKIKPTPIGAIGDTFPVKATIPCLEGVLTKVYEDRTGDGEYGAYTITGAKLMGDDQEEVKITFFGGDEPLIPPSAWKKRIRIESTTNQKGSAGITRDKDYEGTIQIKVSKAANISWPEGAPKADTGGKASGDGKSKSDGSVNSGGNQKHGYGSKPLKELIKDYSMIFQLVSADEVLGKLEEGNRKDIAATMFITSDRAGGPNWGNDKAEPKKETKGEPGNDEEDDDIPFEKEEPKPEDLLQGSKWQDVVHPAAKMALGKLPSARLKNGVKGAMIKKLPEGAPLEARRIHAALMMAAAEKHWTEETLVTEHLEAQEGFTQDKFAAWSKQAYGCEPSDLHQENWHQIITTLDESTKAILETEPEDSDDIPGV